MKNRNENHASQIEAMLQQLPQAAAQGLGGLTAGSHLKARIQLAATAPKKARFRIPMRLLAPVACCAAALVLFLALGTPWQQPDHTSLIISSSLGNETPLPGVLTGDLENGTIRITAGNRNPGYRSIWANANGGSFPLVGVNGRYYRLLTSPRDVPDSLLGSSLGTVAEYTTEPSLSGTNTILSNTVGFGKPVYAVRGMNNTLIAAEVNGEMRLFQRVSFNGNARRGSETLADTLQITGQVVAMELSGVGTITDPAVCERLLSTLLNCAVYESSGSVSSQQSLLIELNNRLVLQMAVRGDNLAACGVWSCPEFLEAFEDACN